MANVFNFAMESPQEKSGRLRKASQYDPDVVLLIRCFWRIGVHVCGFEITQWLTYELEMQRPRSSKYDTNRKECPNPTIQPPCK